MPVEAIRSRMESKGRALVIVVFALSIAGLLTVRDASDQRSVEEYNRSQSRVKMTYDGGWLTGVASLLALGIAVMEGRALWVAVKRDRGVRRKVQ